jgi:hypothetical protein
MLKSILSHYVCDCSVMNLLLGLKGMEIIFSNLSKRNLSILIYIL